MRRCFGPPLRRSARSLLRTCPTSGGSKPTRWLAASSCPRSCSRRTVSSLAAILPRSGGWSQRLMCCWRSSRVKSADPFCSALVFTTNRRFPRGDPATVGRRVQCIKSEWAEEHRRSQRRPRTERPFSKPRAPGRAGRAPAVGEQPSWADQPLGARLGRFASATQRYTVCEEVSCFRARERSAGAAQGFRRRSAMSRRRAPGEGLTHGRPIRPPGSSRGRCGANT